jgi:hypothetical protein
MRKRCFAAMPAGAMVLVYSDVRGRKRGTGLCTPRRPYNSGSSHNSRAPRWRTKQKNQGGRQHYQAFHNSASIICSAVHSLYGYVLP